MLQALKDSLSGAAAGNIFIIFSCAFGSRVWKYFSKLHRNSFSLHNLLAYLCTPLSLCVCQCVFVCLMQALEHCLAGLFNFQVVRAIVDGTFLLTWNSLRICGCSKKVRRALIAFYCSRTQTQTQAHTHIHSGTQAGNLALPSGRQIGKCANYAHNPNMALAAGSGGVGMPVGSKSQAKEQ